MSLSTVLKYGIFSQGGVSRPEYFTEMKAASLMQNSADATFNVYANTDRAFTMCLWGMMLTGETGTFVYYTGRETSSSNRHFQLYHFNNQDAVVFITPTTEAVVADATGIQAIKGKWYFYGITATEAGSKDKRILVYDENGFIGSGQTSTYTMSTNNVNFRLLLGATRYASGQAIYYTGMNAVGFWNEVKSNDFINTMWNNGNGLSYSHLNTAQKTGLVEWWDLDDWDGTKCVGNHDGGSNTQMVRNNNGSTAIAKVSR